MSEAKDMDQFMNDFLEGKYLEDNHNNSSRRKSHNDSDYFKPRRSSNTKVSVNQTPEDGLSGSMERLCVSDQGDKLGPIHGRRRRSSKTPNDEKEERIRKINIRRTKSANKEGRRNSKQEKKGRRRSSASDDSMDPQMVIRMLEMYADMNDSEKADAMLHYHQENKEPGRDDSSAKKNALRAA